MKLDNDWCNVQVGDTVKLVDGSEGADSTVELSKTNILFVVKEFGSTRTTTRETTFVRVGVKYPWDAQEALQIFREYDDEDYTPEDLEGIEFFRYRFRKVLEE